MLQFELSVRDLVYLKCEHLELLYALSDGSIEIWRVVSLSNCSLIIIYVYRRDVTVDYTLSMIIFDKFSIFPSHEMVMSITDFQI